MMIVPLMLVNIHFSSAKHKFIQLSQIQSIFECNAIFHTNLSEKILEKNRSRNLVLGQQACFILHCVSGDE